MLSSEAICGDQITLKPFLAGASPGIVSFWHPHLLDRSYAPACSGLSIFCNSSGDDDDDDDIDNNSGLIMFVYTHITVKKRLASSRYRVPAVSR